MASYITRTLLTRAVWMACGACISGSIAHRRGATRRASGSVAATSTKREPPHGCHVALRDQRNCHDRLGQLHVGDGRHADARWLDDVECLDADARAVVRLYGDV